MILYLIRHGIAVERKATTESDEERALTAEGMRRMRQNARGLRRLKVTIDAIWTSPLVRARQTADLLAREYSIGAPTEQTFLKPDADISKIIEPLRKQPLGMHLALVGHEPCLGELTTFLLTGLRTHSFALKKGGTACIQLDSFRRPVRGQLLWMLTPQQTRRIKKES